MLVPPSDCYSAGITQYKAQVIFILTILFRKTPPAEIGPLQDPWTCKPTVCITCLDVQCIFLHLISVWLSTPSLPLPPTPPSLRFDVVECLMTWNEKHPQNQQKWSEKRVDLQASQKGFKYCGTSWQHKERVYRNVALRELDLAKTNGKWRGKNRNLKLSKDFIWKCPYWFLSDFDLDNKFLF